MTYGHLYSSFLPLTPPISYYQKILSNLHLSFFDNPWSLVSTAHTLMAWCHPWKHRKPTDSIFSSNSSSLLAWQLFVVNISSVRAGMWTARIPSMLEILLACAGNYNCCKLVLISMPCLKHRFHNTLHPLVLVFFLLPPASLSLRTVELTDVPFSDEHSFSYSLHSHSYVSSTDSYLLHKQAFLSKMQRSPGL